MHRRRVWDPRVCDSRNDVTDSPFFDGEHRHDWRVDPSQVMILANDELVIRVRCADESCEATGKVWSSPNPTALPGKPKTWRPYRWKRGDELKVDARG